jgi:hypothetical protein
MTWYAGRIYAEPNPELRAALCANAALADHLYLLTDLPELNKHNVIKVDLLGRNDLIVAREVFAEDSREANFPGVVTWDKVVAGSSLVISANTIIIEPTTIFTKADPLDLKSLTNMLHYLKQLSLDTKAVLTFYYCFMWGGDVEEEWAWVFDATIENGDRVYNHNTTYTSDSVQRFVTEYSAPAHAPSVNHPKGDVLMLALRHLGIFLPTPYFVPHTVPFGWTPYKLDCSKEG